MPCKAAEASVEWVTDDARLAEVVGGWGRVIGLDTEFQRTDTFFPLPGLYQVSSGTEVWHPWSARESPAKMSLRSDSERRG